MTQMRHLAKHSVSLCVAAPFWLKRETEGSPTNVQVLSIAASSCRGLPLPISAQKSLYTIMTSPPGYEIVREPLECPVHGNRKCQCVALKDKRTGRVYFTSMEILKLMHSVPGAAGDPATKQCGGTANVEPQPDPANRTRQFEGIPNVAVHSDPCKKEKTSPAPQRKCDGAPLKRVKYDHESDSSDANYRQNDDAKPRRRSPPPLPPPPPAAAPKWSSNESKLFHAGVPPARTGTGRPIGAPVTPQSQRRSQASAAARHTQASAGAGHLQASAAARHTQASASARHTQASADAKFVFRRLASIYPKRGGRKVDMVRKYGCKKCKEGSCRAH